MATTYDFTNGSIVGHPRMTSQEPTENTPFFLRHVIDFSIQNLDSSATDVAKCLNIPAYVEVLDAWIRVITAETADACVNLGYGSDVDYWGKNLNLDATGTAKRVLPGSATWDASSIADGDEEAKEVTVAGAAIGDHVEAELGVDIADLQLTADVTAEDTVTVTLSNSTGGAIDLASTTLSVRVFKANLNQTPLYFSSADTIDISCSTTNGDVDLDGAKIEVVAMCRKVLAT